MANARDFRRLALALPGAEEGSHMRHADFRVGGRIFASLTTDERVGTLKLPGEVQASVLGRPDAGAKDVAVLWPASGAWGRQGWTQVRLADVPAALVGALLREAWFAVAPAAAKAAAPRPAGANAAPAKQAPTRKIAAQQAPAKKVAARKTPAKQAPAKKVAAKKVAAKKVAARKTPPKQAPAKKAVRRREA